jgi:hypothetical protein
MKYKLIISGTKEEVESIRYRVNRVDIRIEENLSGPYSIDRTYTLNRRDVEFKVVESSYRFKTLSELAAEFGDKLTVHPTVHAAIAVRVGVLHGAELSELGKPASKLDLTNPEDWKRVMLKEVTAEG